MERKQISPVVVRSNGMRSGNAGSSWSFVQHTVIRSPGENSDEQGSNRISTLEIVLCPDWSFLWCGDQPGDIPQGNVDVDRLVQFYGDVPDCGVLDRTKAKGDLMVRICIKCKAAKGIWKVTTSSPTGSVSTDFDVCLSHIITIEQWLRRKRVSLDDFVTR